MTIPKESVTGERTTTVPPMKEEGTQTARRADERESLMISTSSTSESEEEERRLRRRMSKKKTRVQRHFEVVSSDSSESDTRTSREKNVRRTTASSEVFEVERVVLPHPDTVLPVAKPGGAAPFSAESFWADQDEFGVSPTTTQDSKNHMESSDSFGDVQQRRSRTTVESPVAKTAKECTAKEAGLPPIATKSRSRVRAAETSKPPADSPTMTKSAGNGHAVQRKVDDPWETNDDVFEFPADTTGTVAKSSPNDTATAAAASTAPIEFPGNVEGVRERAVVHSLIPFPAADDTSSPIETADEKKLATNDDVATDWFHSAVDPTASFFLDFEDGKDRQQGETEVPPDFPDPKQQEWDWPDAEEESPWPGETSSAPIATKTTVDDTLRLSGKEVKKLLSQDGPISDLLRSATDEKKAPPFPEGDFFEEVEDESSAGVVMKRSLADPWDQSWTKQKGDFWGAEAAGDTFWTGQTPQI